MKIFRTIFCLWSNYFNIRKIKKEQNILVFYSEHSSDWMYLEPVIQDLQNKGINVVRLTSDENDNFLKMNNTYYIGSGILRTIIFRTIDTKGFVMTLTDLNTFHLKKSIYPVHYFYLFHSLVSTHRVYREHAFNGYDTIFCCGNYQIEEIRETEKKYNLNNKVLIKQGYVRLDELLNKKISVNHKNKNIIIAPTWGISSLIKKSLEKLIKILLTNQYNVTLRLHPMTLRHDPSFENKIKTKFRNHKNFYYESDLKTKESVQNGDIMISDWSGAALEFAFTTLKPVVFIDTNPKINNKKWKIIDKPCFEEYIREEIGIIIAENDIEKIDTHLIKLFTNLDKWSNKILNIRNNNIFNVGKSSMIAAETIIKTLKM